MTRMTKTVQREVREIVQEVWRAVHSRRFDASGTDFKGPDNFYHGVQVARDEVGRIGRRLGLTEAQLHHDE